MTDKDRSNRIRTAALTLAVFAAFGGGAYALFQLFRGAAEAPRISRVPQALPVPEYDFAYASDKDGDFDIYLTTLDRDLELSLTDHPLGESGPAWSRDGKLIAYSILDDAGSDIWVTTVSEGEARAITSETGDEDNPTWSPDGEKLAFMSTNSIIEVVNLDSSGRHRLTDGSASDFHPAWSPDGARIAYAHNAGDHENSDIWVMKPSGASKEAVTHWPGSEQFPAWSPNGEMIAFVDNSGQIYVVHLEDRTVRQLTNDQTRKGPLSWSPDGHHILYVAYTEDQTDDRDLFVIEAIGGVPQEVITGPTYDTAPAWNPVAASSK
jgi:Tol biopolymer transport system component